jgi:hypothetical protein
LEKAVYQLTADKRLNIREISMPDAEIIKIRKLNIYTWKYHNFTPSNDFVVRLE